MDLIITAGFERSQNALAIAEKLRRKGHNILGIIVISSVNFKRFQSFIRQRGLSSVLKLSEKLFKNYNKAKSPLSIYLKDNKIESISIKSWCKTNNVSFVKVKNINDKKALDFLKEKSPDYVIYGGGGIIRKSFIKVAKDKIINAHSGPLPYIRGMNACEWSILMGYKPCITVHFINRGIDTGDILYKKEIKIEKDDNINALREKCTVTGIESIVEVVENIDSIKPEKVKDADKYRQCFIMSEAIKEILEKKLKKVQL